MALQLIDIQLTLLQETVQGETYLGLLIFRFYIRCPRCISEITFKVITCPQKTALFLKFIYYPKLPLGELSHIIKGGTDSKDKQIEKIYQSLKTVFVHILKYLKAHQTILCCTNVCLKFSALFLVFKSVFRYSHFTYLSFFKSSQLPLREF